MIVKTCPYHSVLTSILVTVFLFANLSGKAQTIQPTFFNTGEGASSSIINGIIQDSYGLLWIAGEGGLQKYDGYRFQNFKQNPNDPNSLLHNICWGVLEDSDRNIWVSTQVGISRYDRVSSDFTNYPMTDDLTGSDNTGVIFNMFQDSQNRLFCGFTAISET